MWDVPPESRRRRPVVEERRMSERGGDWRSSPAYDYVDDSGAEKIAHEFLRRNDQYPAD